MVYNKMKRISFQCLNCDWIVTFLKQLLLLSDFKLKTKQFCIFVFFFMLIFYSLYLSETGD